MRIYARITVLQTSSYVSSSGQYTLGISAVASFINPTSGVAVNTPSISAFGFLTNKEGLEESVKAAVADYIVSNYSLDATSADVIIY